MQSAQMRAADIDSRIRYWSAATRISILALHAIRGRGPMEKHGGTHNDDTAIRSHSAPSRRHALHRHRL
ncbi:hypothetical protein PT2222_80191 [Paraburkholderia tropica]